MQLPPIEVVLKWPKPNYQNPSEIRAHELLIITIIFFPLAIGMVGLRTFTRLRISKCWGVDDIVLLCSVPPTLAIAVLTILAVRDWGWDRHIWDVKPSMISDGLRSIIAMQCLFAIAVTCYKLSLLILTRRFMTSGTGILRHVAAAGMVIVVAECVVFVIVVVFTCSPVSAYWTFSVTPQHCINEKTHLLVAGIINTSTDFLVFFLPLPTLSRLKIPFRQQLVLTLLFGAGLVVCVAGMVRILYTWRATSTFDRTWESYGVWIASMLELYIGIICAAIPACKPFFSLYIPSLLGSSFGQSKDVQELIITGYSRPHNRAQSRPQSRPSNISHPRPQLSEECSDPHDVGKLEATFIHTRSTSDQILPLGYLDTHDMRSEKSIWEESNDNSSNSLVDAPQRKSKTPRSKFSIGGEARAQKLGTAESRRA